MWEMLLKYFFLPEEKENTLSSVYQEDTAVVKSRNLRISQGSDFFCFYIQRDFFLLTVGFFANFLLLEFIIPEVTMLSSAVLGIWIITSVAIWT